MIRFDVIFNRTEVADCVAPCFGWLSSANEEWYRESKIQTPDNKHLATGFTAGKPAQELVWYVEQSVVSVANRTRGWEIIKEILSEISWLSDVVLARPETQTVHVKLGDTPCDKSILCMGIIRNYFMIKSFQDSYRKAREVGASVQEAYIFAGLVEVNTHWNGGWSGCTRELWEYDSVNSNTFGEEALRVMFKPDYAPWGQGTWLEQAGYHREHTLGEDFQNLYGEHRQMKLLDTFSVENDEEILDDQGGIIIHEDEEVELLVKQIRQVMQS